MMIFPRNVTKSHHTSAAMASASGVQIQIVEVSLSLPSKEALKALLDVWVEPTDIMMGHTLYGMENFMSLLREIPTPIARCIAI